MDNLIVKFTEGDSWSDQEQRFWITDLTSLVSRQNRQLKLKPRKDCIGLETKAGDGDISVLKLCSARKAALQRRLRYLTCFYDGFINCSKYYISLVVLLFLWFLIWFLLTLQIKILRHGLIQNENLESHFQIFFFLYRLFLYSVDVC